MSSEPVKNQEIAIKLDGVCKSFQIYEKPHHRLMQGLFRGKKQFFREFKALENISFEIKRGETVGIIGCNGAGKSTLLQIICGTMTPTTGSVEINGRVGALLELGSGFNPEFTGRENVFMNGAILGLTQEEIENRFDDITAFADIGDFIEQPVKTYSSGMFLRLAFAVNIMSKPEIMIVDEALAVGDMNFQAKCITALTRLQESGSTVLFVSHDIGTVKSLCSQGIYLEKGRIKKIGLAADVAEAYIRNMREQMNESVQDLSSVESSTKNTGVEHPGSSASEFKFKSSELFKQQMQGFRYGSGGASITYVELLNENGENMIEAEFDQVIQIKIFFECTIQALVSPNYYIMDDKKNLILGASPRQIGHSFVSCKPGSRHIVVYKTRVPLHEGTYSIQIQLNQPKIENETAEFLDVIDDAVVFKVARRSSGRVWSKVFLSVAMEVQSK
tara:strand:- start:94214 stop:95551 length:1338 start_codon:yes stop_codon:yes gene_type:complete